jgi:hypothetical protein
MPLKSWYPTNNIRIVRVASHPSGVDQAVREVVFYSIGNGKISSRRVEWLWRSVESGKIVFFVE